MVITLHLCGPPGEATRRELAQILNILKEDNRLVIQAMLKAGHHVPDTVIDLGLEYRPPIGEEIHTPHQGFYCMADMVERGTFSCGDAAAYEAAVQEEKYGIPTEVIVVPQGESEYHALYVSPSGPVDPTENWLAADAAARGRTHRRAAPGANRWGAR